MHCTLVEKDCLYQMVLLLQEEDTDQTACSINQQSMDQQLHQHQHHADHLQDQGVRGAFLPTAKGDDKASLLHN